MSALQFRLLGPLGARLDGVDVDLGSAATRATLAVLLLNAPSAVSTDRLVDELWGDDVPESARKMVQIRVSKLRKELPEGTIATVPPGYALSGEDIWIDLLSFDDLFETGRKALADGDPEAARERLGAALDLWRGPALVEFREPFAQREHARLEELRLACLEERIEADLALGGGPELVAELETLVAQHPFRERLCGQLMRALYRQDRQADALAAYQHARQTLVEELGIEPGRTLQELERAILQQDSALGERRPAASRPSVDSSPPPAATAQPAPTPGWAAPLVGRRREQERIEAALEGALAGSGRLVILSGEPGIGKTRLVGELAAAAELRGARVLWGRCYEGDGAPPYWPWVQALRRYVSERGAAAAREELGSAAAVLAEMVAELRDVWPDLDEPAELPDAKQARFRLLEAVGLWLTRACGSSPMVVIIEDVHAADSDSLTMLGYVAGELARLPVLVVVTHRDSGTTRTADLTGALAELSRVTSPERIALGGLDENAVSEYIRLTLGEDVAERLAAQVYSRTDGNPLFVSEIVRLLEASVQTGGADDAALLVSTVPEGVRAAIGQRVATLSQASRDLLEFASVIGREFSFDQVEALRPELGGEELLDAFDEALESGLLEEAPQAVGYRFAHALIRDALLDGLSRRRRARLEAEVADGLESFYGARADDHAAELARHYAEAEPILGDAKLITYSRAAAERALAMHAYEEAMVHARRALESDPDEAPADSNAAAMLFLLARAELGALELYELGGALGRMAAAFEFYCDAGDRASALEIAIHPVPPLWERTAAPVMLDRALTMVEPDSLAAGQLSASKGWFIGAHDGDYAGAEAAFGRALEIAERLDDPELERRSVVTQAQVDYWHMHWSECGERGERAIRLSQEAGDARTEMIAREWPARVAAIRGDPESAVKHAAAAVGLAERLRERHELATACMYFGWLRSLTGQWEPARNLSDRALDLQPREPRNLATRAILELQTGNTAEGESQLQRLLDPERQTTWGLVEKLIVAAFVPMARRITEGDSGLDTAETSARAVLATPMPPLLHLYPRLGLALLAIMRDDRELADEAYEGLVGQRGTVVIMASVATDRILGSLAAMAGNPASAREHFEQALALCERAGYLPELAWTAADFAEVLARAGSDRPRAAELREQALALAERISMEPLLARVERAPR